MWKRLLVALGLILAPSAAFAGGSTPPGVVLGNNSGQTATHCAQWSAAGALIDSGGTCGTGTAGVTQAQGTTNQVLINGDALAHTGAAVFTLPASVALGTNGTAGGSLVLNGATSGSVTQAVPTAPGAITITWGNTSGTPAVIASAPLVINTTTGTIACATCATTISGGALSATSPIAISAGGNITLSGTVPVANGGIGITSGTSGGVPYFSGASTIASSAALTLNLPVIGGGAGSAPTVGSVSGNTTKFVTTTGLLTSGDCVKVDASGNFVDNGSACGSGSGTPGGTSGQIQYNNAGAFGGFTASGDATINTGTGAITVTKTNGVAFAASATTDTTNATNITSGTLPNAQVPVPTAIALGGVESLVCGGGQFLSGISTLGVPSCGTPAGGGNFSITSATTNGVVYATGSTAGTTTAVLTTGQVLAGNTAAAPTGQSIPTVLGSQTQNLVFASPNGVSGNAAFRALVGADLPNPGASSLGGVQSFAAVAHNFVTQISTLGVVTAAQPAAADITGLAASATTDTTNAGNISSGTLLAARMPALTGDVTTTAGTVATTLATTQSAAHTWSGRQTFGSGLNVFLRNVTATGAVTVATTDYFVCVNKTVGAATTVNLPGSPTQGDTYLIKDCKGDAATNNITVTPAVGNIDGSATYVMNTNHQSVAVTYDGTQWEVN